MAQEYIPTSPASPQFYSQDEWLQRMQEPVRSTQTGTQTPGPGGATETPGGQQPQQGYQKPQGQAPPTTPQHEYQAPTTGQISVGPYTPDTRIQGAFSSLFQPTQQTLQQQYTGLGTLAGGFNQAAGAPRTWDSIGGKGALDTAIQGGDIAAGQGLVNAGANYQAPTLDQGALDKMIAPWQDVLSRGRSLDTSAGAADLLAAQNPGMTIGEKRLSGQNLYGQQGYQDAAEAQQQDIAKFYGDFLRTQGEAQAISKLRTGQEQDISKQATGYLGGLNQNWLTAEQGKVGEATKNQQAVKDAWLKMTQGGALPDSSLTTGIPNTELDARKAQAQQTWDKTMGEFADIKDVPLMELSIDKQGREKYVFPEDFGQGLTGKALHEARKRAIARQHALENAGFSPGNKQMKAPKGLKTRKDLPIGEFAAFNPLYQQQAGSYQPADYLDYSALEAGTTPTVENLAGAGELDRYNLIQQMLGRNSLEAPGPGGGYAPARINIDEAGFKAGEQANYDKAARDLRAAALSEIKKVAHRRKQYRDSHGAGVSDFVNPKEIVHRSKKYLDESKMPKWMALGS